MKINVNIEFECTENELKTLCGSDLEETIIAMIGEKIIEEKMAARKQPIKKAATKKVKRQAPKKAAVNRSTSK